MEDEKEKNLEYLKKDLKYLGFGEKLYEALELTINDKPEKFKLIWNGEFQKPDGNKDSVRYMIDFKKSDKSERYFLNSYTATLQNEADPTKEKAQTFYVDKGKGITAKEAYNMLDGRAVHKKQTNRENQEYMAWVQFDFSNKEPNGNFKTKMFHQNYGFDLPDALSKHPIKELNDDKLKKDLLAGLEKGSVRPAMLIKDNVEEKVFLVANPQFKNVRVFDVNMKQLSQGGERKEQEPDQKKEKKESVKKDADDDHSEKSGKKQKRKGPKV